jgi:hypothetical protein
MHYANLQLLKRKSVNKRSTIPYNKRMQTDQNVRYALILTADAGVMLHNNHAPT